MIDILKALWPFISEMFFEGKSLKEIVTANKRMTILLVILGLSLTLNYFSVGKLWDIAVDKQKTKPPSPAASQPTDKPLLPLGNPASAASAPSSQGTGLETEQQRQERLRKRLQDLYKDSP